MMSNSPFVARSYWHHLYIPGHLIDLKTIDEVTYRDAVDNYDLKESIPKTEAMKVKRRN